MAEAFQKFVPDSVSPPTSIPLTYHKYLQQNIAVYKAIVTTSVSGTTVTLPANFQALLSASTQYGVTLTKETFNPNGGELYISNKTTTSFKVRNSGTYYGDTVFVQVYWIPA